MGSSEMRLMVAKLLGDDDSAFERLSSELQGIHRAGLMRGGKDYEGEGVGSPVEIDAAEAQRRGFSAEAVALAEDLAALTNRLVATLSAGNPSITRESAAGLESSLPGVSAFFTLATARRGAAPEIEEGAAGVDSDADELEAQGITGFSHAVCGYFPNPKPKRAVEPAVHDVPDPAATLREWGYHETPDQAGGGWTRPQTYKRFFCGVSTFRDHAYIRSDGRISEQNYTGRPGGEPNPEVWRSGPWPYPEWPAYVLWWHQTH